MSKKMKGVALESSPYAVTKEAKTKFKHHSLLQDYQELHKETDAAKKKLKKLNQKKSTLLAEVQFLRRRYKYLSTNLTLKPPPVRETAQPQSSETQRKRIMKERKYGRKQAALRQPVPHSDLNLKRINYTGNDIVLKSPIYGNEALLQGGRVYSGKEAVAPNPKPVFDLNQISREEEEFQVNSSELLRMDLPKNSIRSESDEQYVDMKLSACRNIGNGSSRAGKRKISWQDQVVLRV